MRLSFFNHIILVLLALMGFQTSLKSQIVQGTVYDISQRIPIQGVSVLTASGYGTQTDSNGFYAVKVVPNDSIWFSYLGKPTPKYPVKSILNPAAFDISVQIPAIELPGVTIKKPSYRADSIQNRQEYAKYFNYRKPGLRISTDPSIGAGVGVDLDEIINVFRFRRNRNLAFIQRWLIYQEQDKYVDHRFSKLFVHKLTGLESPQLDTFMYHYRPSFEVVSIMSDADLGIYILNCYKDYSDRMNPYFRKPSIPVAPKP
ncbi:MAG: hypothetical protein C5B52_02980 [Bacteroidetes bacterium]|nr:MAG: hypothetical protein C5B52_02980 [Bacteroidota bacterium]